MVIIVWRDMNNVLINGDGFSCNLFYLKVLAGRMYSKAS